MIAAATSPSARPRTTRPGDAALIVRITVASTGRVPARSPHWLGVDRDHQDVGADAREQHQPELVHRGRAHVLAGDGHELPRACAGRACATPRSSRRSSTSNAPGSEAATREKYSLARGTSPLRSYRSASTYHCRTWRSEGLRTRLAAPTSISRAIAARARLAPRARLPSRSSPRSGPRATARPRESLVVEPLHAAGVLEGALAVHRRRQVGDVAAQVVVGAQVRRGRAPAARAVVREPAISRMPVTRGAASATGEILRAASS